MKTKNKNKKKSIEHGRDYHKQSYALMVFALRLCSHLIIGLRLVSYGLVAEIIIGKDLSFVLFIFHWAKMPNYLGLGLPSCFLSAISIRCSIFKC
jgi:hypothetical protein